MTFEVTGLEEFLNDLEEFADDIEKVRKGLPEVLDESTEKAARDLHGEMILQINRLADNPSGNLASSIETDRIQSAKSGEAAVWSTGPTADYAKHVEYGTGTKGDPRHASGEEYTITPKELTTGDIREMRINAQGDPGLSEELKDAPALDVPGSDNPVLFVNHPGSNPTPYWRTAIGRFVQQDRFVEQLDKHTSALFQGMMK